MKHCSFALLTVFTCTAFIYAADVWPEFRGPTGDGHYDKGALPTVWSKTKNVTWVQKIPGLAWSSPVIGGERIYLTTAVNLAGLPLSFFSKKDYSLRTLCVNAKDGKILWNEEVFQEDMKAPAIHTKNSHASPTPILHGERLYVHFGHEGTACLDLNGKVLWRQTSLTYKPVHGNGGTPILVDDMLVFSIDGADKQMLVALDLKSGDVRWKTERKTNAPKKFSFHTPLLIDVDGTKQIVSSGSDMVGGYNPKTGEEIWRVRYTGYSVIPRPVYGHGLVFISTSYDSPSLLAIRPTGKGDVTETHVAWKMRKGAPHTPSPLLVGEELYVVADNGLASCVDAKTGTVHWQEKLGGAFSASPLYADGKIYFQSEEGVGTVVKAGKQYEMIAKNDLEERSLASYAAANGALFIRTEEHLYRIETKSSR